MLWTRQNKPNILIPARHSKCADNIRVAEISLALFEIRDDESFFFSVPQIFELLYSLNDKDERLNFVFDFSDY